MIIAQDDITIVGADGAVLDGTGCFYGWLNGIETSGGGVTVENLEIRNFNGAGVMFGTGGSGGDPVVVRNCDLHDNIFGISAPNADYDVLIENNTVHYNGYSGAFGLEGGAGITVAALGTPVAVTIRGNEIYDHFLGEAGGYMQAPDGLGIGVSGVTAEVYQNRVYDNAFGIWLSDAPDAAVYDNLVYEATEDSVLYGMAVLNPEAFTSARQGGGGPLIAHNTINGGSWDGIYTLGEDTVIEYNIITNFGNYGINNEQGSPTPGTPVIDYNDVWNNGSAPLFEDNYSGCSAGANDISEDPLYTDPATGDFHLLYPSPCREAGPGAGVTEDFAGNVRPMGWPPPPEGKGQYDMGAHEYVYTDTDTDLMDDGYEGYYFGDLSHDGTGDGDDDDLDDKDEFDAGTNPLVADTDGDLFSDGEEVAMGSDPTDPEDEPEYVPGTYYVDGARDTSGTGTAEAPWNSLHHAIDRINSGESTGNYLLSVAPAVYNVVAEGGKEPDEPLGVSQEDLKIAGEAGAILDGTGASGYLGWSNGIEVYAPGVSIQNLDVGNFPNAGVLLGLGGSEGGAASVRNCNIHDNGYAGISANATDYEVVIEDNVVADNDALAGSGVGVSISYATEGAFVRRNVISGHSDVYNESGHGVIIDESDARVSQNELVDNRVGVGVWYYSGQGDMGLSERQFQWPPAPIVENNVVYQEQGDLQIGIELRDFGGIADATIRHNTVDGGTGDGIDMYSTGTVAVKYNIVTNFEGYGIDCSESGGVTLDYNNVYGNALGSYSTCPGPSNSISQDPAYDTAVTGAAGYALQETSPCIDVIPGTVLDAADLDFRSTTRPRDGDNNGSFDYDMGAFEYPFLIYEYTLPGGTGEATDYRIFTVPVRLGAETGADLLDAMLTALGQTEYEPSQWRGFAYDEDYYAIYDNYMEFDSIDFQSLEVHPGDAFWIISLNGDPVDFGGLLWGDAAVYEVPLDPGWNLVGLPWPDPEQDIAVENIAVTDGTDTFWITSGDNTLTDGEFLTYTGGEDYITVGAGESLEVGVGYWLYVEPGPTVTMLVPPNNEGGSIDARSVQGGSGKSAVWEREGEPWNHEPHKHTRRPPPPPGR